jgi:hypothetical protein
MIQNALLSCCCNACHAVQSVICQQCLLFWIFEYIWLVFWFRLLALQQK